MCALLFFLTSLEPQLRVADVPLGVPSQEAPVLEPSSPLEEVAEVEEQEKPPLSPSRREAVEVAVGGFEESGGVFLVSAGVAGIVDFATMFQWGMRMGAFRSSPSTAFAASYSFFFDHYHGNNYTSQHPALSDDVFLSTHVVTNVLTLGGEARLGASLPNVFGYGLLGVGAVISHSKLTVRSTPNNESSSEFMSYGVVFPFGAGVQVLLADRFVAGLEGFAGFGPNHFGLFNGRLVLGGKW